MPDNATRPSAIGWLLPGPNPHRLAMFFDQLARMSAAGMAPVQALTAIRDSVPGRLSKAAAAMAARITGGGTFADAMRSQPGVFTPLQVSIVEASEHGGAVVNALRTLAAHLERSHRRRREIITGLAYPIFVLHLAILLPPLYYFFVKDGWAYLHAVWPGFAVLYGIFAAVYVLRRLMSGPGQGIGDGVVLLIPIAGGVTRRLALARFVRACQCLYEAGVNIAQCVRQAAAAAGNQVIQRRLLSVADQLVQGTPFADALRSVRLFRADALAFIETGTDAGQLSESLDHVAEQLEFEADTSVNRVLKVLPVLVILIVGVIIGYIYITAVLKLYAPIMDMRHL